MIRRDFLKRLTMTAAGLLVADDVLAMITEPRRKVWPVGIDLRARTPRTKAVLEWSDDDGHTWHRIPVNDLAITFRPPMIEGLKPNGRVDVRAYHLTIGGRECSGDTPRA